MIKASSNKSATDIDALTKTATEASAKLEAAVKSLEAQKKTIDELKASAEKLPSSDQVTQLKAQIEAAETANREQMTALKDQQANMNKAIEELKNNAPKVLVVSQPAPAAASTTGGDAQLQSPDTKPTPAAAPVVDPKDQLAQSAQP